VRTAPPWCGVALALLALAGTADAACPPGGWPIAALQSLKGRHWKLDDAVMRERLAVDLLPCLRAPDPVLRDELAFDALQTWLRGAALGVPQTREIGVVLVAALRAPDADGFGAPFAALALSEVVRADRMQAFWSPAERQAVLDAALAWMAGVRDYRGFEPGVGWRHGVAHGADLLLQLALNPVLDKAQLDTILGAVASQAMPAGHSYVHGESERLARPLLFVARRGLHSEAEWTAWFTRLAASATPAAEAPATVESLARAHNFKGLVHALYASVMEGGDAALRERLRPALVAALRALP
jgi:hypothetical protein